MGDSVQEFTRLSRPFECGLVWPPPSTCQVPPCPRNNCQRGRQDQSSNPCFSCNLSKLFSVSFSLLYSPFSHISGMLFITPFPHSSLVPNYSKETHPGLKESHEDGWTPRMLGAGHVIANQHLIALRLKEERLGDRLAGTTTTRAARPKTRSVGPVEHRCGGGGPVRRSSHRQL